MHPTSTGVRVNQDPPKPRRFSANKLRTRRRQAGLARYELAILIGRGPEAVGRYERDQGQPPVDVAERIAIALGCTLDDLLA